MKILLVSNMYPSDENPSYGTFVKGQVNILETEDTDIELAVMYKVNNKFLKIISYLTHYLSIMYKLMFNNYDVIIIHYASLNALPFIILNKMRKFENIIVNVHGSDIIPETNIQEKLNFFTKKLISIAEHVIVPSQYYKEIVAKKYHFSAEKIFISPSGGIDREIFNEKKNIDKLSEFTLGFVGRIDVGKGWDDILIAFSKLIANPDFKNSRLIMVGSGRQKEERNNLINKLNIKDNITLYDFQSHSQLSELYNKLDLFIFPTKRNAESLGLVGLEAMSCGVPVVGSRIGGLKSYIVDGKNGFYFEPANSQEIYDCIVKFKQLSNAEVSSMKTSAIDTAKAYDSKLVGRELRDFIQQFNNNK